MILGRYRTGLCAKCQRKVASTIKAARQMGFVPTVSDYEVRDTGPGGLFAWAGKGETRPWGSEGGGRRWDSVSGGRSAYFAAGRHRSTFVFFLGGGGRRLSVVVLRFFLLFCVEQRFRFLELSCTL